MILRVSAAILAALSFQTVACAQILFTEDFQDGQMTGWTGDAGRGTLQLTEHESNMSLRLTRNAWAAIALASPIGVRLSAVTDFAAAGLEKQDSCVVEVSANPGEWTILGLVDADSASDIKFKTVGGDFETSADSIALRVRANGNTANDTCWADNIQVRYVHAAFDEGALANALALAELGTPGALPGPWATSVFSPSPHAATPDTEFIGTLHWHPGPIGDSKRVLIDRYGAEEQARLYDLPPFDINLVQSGRLLLPAGPGLLLTRHPHWDYVLSPGRVWKEPGDGDWSRAALPFALVEKNANCTHNGLLTFAFRADGTSTPSVWQIGSETCAYFQFDAWGTATTAITPDANSGDAAVRARDKAERATRLEIRPLSSLATDYPGIDLEPFGSPADIAPTAMTTFGVVVGDVHYVGGCDTRYGLYPYCDEMILPSYSLAKSLFAGLALARLEHLHPGAMKARISDYVPACRQVGTWDEVTFENALDMATGHYLSAKSEADEDSATEGDFFIFETSDRKTRFACEHFPHRTAPGLKWVYHTTDTYLLGEAMQAFLRTREGPAADIYRDLLVEPIWKPLGLSTALDDTRRTADDSAQPFTGWGLFMQRGDLARIIRFLSSRNGSIAGEQVISGPALSAALQQVPSDAGLPADALPLKYNNGFWSWDIQAYGGCPRSTPIPFMSGFGGLVVVLIPNGTSYYYVSDGGAFAWARAALATETIAPFCHEASE